MATKRQIAKKQNKSRNTTPLQDILDKQAEEAIKNSKKVQDKKNIKEILNKAKKFVKNNMKNINKHAKEIIQEIRKEHGKSKSVKDFAPGNMLAYRYDAKYNERTFDKKPLIICLGYPKNRKFRKTHMYGLNLHWLPVNERVSVATYFLELKKKKGGKLVYEDVKPWLDRYKNSKVLRMYIIKNVSNKIIKIPDDDTFLVATSLKTEKFIRGID
jgi:hypothetical protein